MTILKALVLIILFFCLIKDFIGAFMKSMAIMYAVKTFLMDIYDIFIKIKVAELALYSDSNS